MLPLTEQSSSTNNTWWDYRDGDAQLNAMMTQVSPTIMMIVSRNGLVSAPTSAIHAPSQPSNADHTQELRLLDKANHDAEDARNSIARMSKAEQESQARVKKDEEVINSLLAQIEDLKAGISKEEEQSTQRATERSEQQIVLDRAVDNVEQDIREAHQRSP